MDDLKRRVQAERRKAELAATESVDAWRRAQLAEMDADTTLTPAQRKQRKMEIFVEVTKRWKKANAKARRDNTVDKVLIRDLMAQPGQDD